MADKILKDMTLSDVVAVLTDRWSQLDDMKTEYLSDAGIAAKEAYRAIIWYTAFHHTLESLMTDSGLQDLLSIPSKHAEYYKVIRGTMRGIEAILQAKEDDKIDRI